MKTSLSRAFALLALGGMATLVVAQTKPGKTQPKTEQRVVKGTTQLAGDDGKVGVTYTIGQQDPLNITLVSAEYRVGPWTVDGYNSAPPAEQKMLLLTYTIHNPNKSELNYNSSTLKFTVVDQDGENHSLPNQPIRKGDTQSLSIALKPAQKVEVQRMILVPAKGQAPKLMVEHRSGGTILRYDMRPIVKPLEKPFSQNGYDADPEIKAEPNTAYPLLGYDIRYVDMGFKERSFGPNTVPAEKVYFWAKVALKKTTTVGTLVQIKGQAVTEDGERIADVGVRKVSTEEYLSNAIDFGQEQNVRILFVVPKTVKITEFRFWEVGNKDSRVIRVPVTAQFAAAAPAEATPATPASVTGVKADEYVTAFKDGQEGRTVMEVAHTENRDANGKRVEIKVGGRRAVLLNDKAAGTVTLHLPDENKTFRAPAAKGNEPETSLTYFTLMYANQAAPKPKKRNPLGALGGQILGRVAENVGMDIINDTFYRGMGGISTGEIVKNTTLSTLHGFTAREYSRALGKATLETAESEDPNAPERLQERTRNGKAVMTETSFKGTKSVGAETFAVKGEPSTVDAATLFRHFAEFMSQGLPKK